MSDEFKQWLRDNPAPDLQQLVREHGGYQNITPAAWTEWDASVADWHARYRDRPTGEARRQ